jgi:hypothetical protein
MKTLVATMLLAVVVAWASPLQAQDFTIEINRGQADAVALSTPKTSPNGLALTWTFDKHNVDLVNAGEPPLPDEPTYLRDVILLPALQSWRRQQLDEGVRAAYAAANEVTKAAVRATLGLP